MNTQLNAIEVRILAALIEKEFTTPEYYPLSVNSLTNACNQKSNREPVVDYSEEEVKEAVRGLREKRLVLLVTGAGSRVYKYKHTFPEYFHLYTREVAALCVLMLRGPQTVGEIRGRSNRMYDFSDLAEVTETLDGLMQREEGPYVAQLERQPGRKEVRYAHLLSGPPEIPETIPGVSNASDPPASDRLADLEAEVEALKAELGAFKQQFVEFRKQFE